MKASSCTVVPLLARGGTLGALAMLNAGDRPPRTEMEVVTAVEVARRGALSLDNARLFDREQMVAEKLQRSLLTDPPHARQTSNWSSATDRNSGCGRQKQDRGPAGCGG